MTGIINTSSFSKTTTAYPYGYSSGIFDEISKRIKSENRQGKIDSILEDKEFVEKKIEDDLEYKRIFGSMYQQEKSHILSNDEKKSSEVAESISEFIKLEFKKLFSEEKLIRGLNFKNIPLEFIDFPNSDAYENHDLNFYPFKVKN